MRISSTIEHTVYYMAMMLFYALISHATGVTGVASELILYVIMPRRLLSNILVVSNYRQTSRVLQLATVSLALHAVAEIALL